MEYKIYFSLFKAFDRKSKKNNKPILFKNRKQNFKNKSAIIQNIKSESETSNYALFIIY